MDEILKSKSRKHGNTSFEIKSLRFNFSDGQLESIENGSVRYVRDDAAVFPELRGEDSEGGGAMIDFNYTAPELLSFRIQEVISSPNEPHRIGDVVYYPVDPASRWFELFGTPELAARTLMEHCEVARCKHCVFCHDVLGKTCEMSGECVWVDLESGYDTLLDWLNGKAYADE